MSKQSLCLIGVATLTVALGIAPGCSPARAQWGGPVKVGYTKARALPVREVVRLPGTVHSRTRALVASEVEGLVVELAAREGDRVQRGQTIVRLRRQKLELELAGARATLAEAEARLEMATSSLTRSRELFDSGVISREQLDNAVSESDAWSGRADQSSAQAARLEDSLTRSTIRAPFSGVVVREHTQVGEWIGVGGGVVELLNLDDLEVVVEVPERHFAQVAVGGGAGVTFESLPGLDVDGTISAVIPRAGDAGRSFPVKVGIANPGGRIAVGMLAGVAFAVGDPRPSTVVPKDAIVAQGRQRIVYVIDPEPAPTAGADGNGGAPAGPPAHAVRPVTVELGGGAGDWVAVTGVEADSWVVVRGNERLAPGATVTPEAVEHSLP